VYSTTYMRAFDIIALGCGQQGSGIANTTVHDHIRCYPSKNFCQYIISLCDGMHHILQILSPCDFFPFHMTETGIERPFSADIQAIQMAVTKQLCSIPESAFQDCSKDPQKHLKWCIVAGGSSF